MITETTIVQGYRRPVEIAADLLSQIEEFYPGYVLEPGLFDCLDRNELKSLGAADALFGDPVRSTEVDYLRGYLWGLNKLPIDVEYGIPVFKERPGDPTGHIHGWTESHEAPVEYLANGKVA